MVVSLVFSTRVVESFLDRLLTIVKFGRERIMIGEGRQGSNDERCKTLNTVSNDDYAVL